MKSSADRDLRKELAEHVSAYYVRTSELTKIYGAITQMRKLFTEWPCDSQDSDNPTFETGHVQAEADRFHKAAQKYLDETLVKKVQRIVYREAEAWRAEDRARK